ncbi:MAG: response regulator [Salibacteraceae bacterium]
MPKEFHVFVVEDDQVYSSILCNTLDEMRPYLADRGIALHYTTFYSGEEAIFELRNDPDLILLDHHLYNDGLEAGDGLEILRKVKVYNPNLSVVVVSGDNDPEVEAALLDSGASHFLPKNAETPARMLEILLQLNQLDSKE